MDDLPTVYVYDHCPFCVRVRVVLGIKNVKHNLHFLANDDIPTPTALVGKKIAPIFVSNITKVLKCVVCVWIIFVLFSVLYIKYLTYRFLFFLHYRNSRKMILLWQNRWILLN